MKKLLFYLLSSSFLCIGTYAAEATGVAAAKSEVSNGNYEKALELFAEAARQNPADANAKTAYTYLKNILSKQESFSHEENAERKQALGTALRNFYYAVGNVKKAQEIDQAVYAAAPTTDNAIKLSSTLLVLQQNQEAETVLAKVSPATASSDLLSAIVAARKGDLAKNRELVGKIALKDLTNPADQLLYARAVAAAGDKVAAGDAIKHIFTNTEPKKLAGLKAFIAQNIDFQKIAGSDELKLALETKSALKDCAGDCAKCPKRKKNNGECDDCEKEKEGKAASDVKAGSGTTVKS